MRSIVITEPYHVALVERPIPEPKEGEALLQMVVGGVCGSDLASYRGQSAYVSYPRTIGHEFAARVVEVGKNPYGIEPGMLVTANPYFNCGKCYSCRRGFFNACSHNETMGVQREGAFSDYFVMPVKRLFDGDGIQPEILACVEPFCISEHAMSRATINPKDKVLVFGSGAIGILAAVTAKILGAEVYITDIAPDKVEKSVRDFGLDGGYVNSSREALDDFIEEVTGGDGFDVTVEAVGAPSSFLDTIYAAASRGQAIVIGVAKHNADFNFLELQRKELNVYGSRGATNDDFLKTMQWIRDGIVDLKPLITRTYPASDAVEAFREMDEQSADIIKAQFVF